MNNIFGLGCVYQCIQKDSNDDIVLVFCARKDNTEDTEGNCRENNCPLLGKGKDGMEVKTMESTKQFIVRSKDEPSKQMHIVINDGQLGVIMNQGMELLVISASVNKDVKLSVVED
jgi:hypothetical protein